MKVQIIGNAVTGWSASGTYEHGIDVSLKPCPFCASHDVDITNTHTPYYNGRCHNCDTEGPLGQPDKRAPGKYKSVGACQKAHREAFDHSIRLWNTRPVEEK